MIQTNKGIQCKCDGCRKTIKTHHIRETFSGHSEGQFFTKTLCEKCIKEVVDKFNAHIKEKADRAAKEMLIEMAKEAENEEEKDFFDITEKK